jgi:hypothetical protein
VTDPPVVVVAGVLCFLFWLIAYAGIIYRGFKDKAPGMPVAALAANLSWESTYAFLLDPLGDEIHILSIPCFVLDLVIAWQGLRYGAVQLRSPFARTFFPVIFFATIAMTFPIVYLTFFEFHDPLGEYNAFGINLMMSILFVAMLLGRDGAGGQSMYIAVSKWLGTLFAWISTALTVTTSTSDPVPSSLASFLADSVTHEGYPLTPLINVLYLGVFVADVLYIVLLRARLRECGIALWRRI